MVHLRWLELVFLIGWEGLNRTETFPWISLDMCRNTAELLCFSPFEYIPKQLQLECQHTKSKHVVSSPPGCLAAAAHGCWAHEF